MKRSYEIVLEAAKKYKTRMEFKNNDKANYSYAVRYKWLDSVCSHMNSVGNLFKRCVYVYEFPGKVCYVGLTFNLEKRHKEHCSSINSSVYKFSFENNIKIPNPIKLTEYEDKDEASKLEGVFLEKYKKSGWTVLNKNKTGGLGGRRKKIENKNIDIGLCKLIAMECRIPTDFIEKYHSLYAYSKKRGWLEYIFSHFDKEEIKKNAIKVISEKNKNKIIDKNRCRENAIKAGLNKKVLQYDLNGNLINEYESIMEAARKINKPDSFGNISRCCKGKLKTSCKFIWRYKNNEV